jgi:diguanylate cyclase (GGDEF)-like protein/PAS domain S-box-containing protein
MSLVDSEDGRKSARKKRSLRSREILKRLVRRVRRDRDTEESLRMSIAMLKAQQEATLDGILVVDSKRQIVSYNHRFLDLWNIDKKFAEDADDDELMKRAFAIVKDFEAVVADVEHLYTHPSEVRSSDEIELTDGRFLSRSTVPVVTSGGRVYGRAWYFRDITENKRAQILQSALFRISAVAHEAKDLGELYASIHSIVGELMDVTNFYIALIDSQTGLLRFPYFVDQYDPAPEGLEASRGLTSLVLNSGKAVLVDESGFKAMVARGEMEEIGAPSVDWLGVPLKAGGKTYGVLTVQSYDQAIRYGNKEKEILEFVSNQIASAIAHKRKENELAANETRYRQMFENNSAVKIVIDPENGRIFDANVAASQFYGYTLEELRSKTIYDINAAPAAEITEKLRTATAQQVTFPHFKHRRKNGELRDVEVHTGPFEADGRRLIYSIIHDITERKRAEESLATANAQRKAVLDAATQTSIIATDATGMITVFNTGSENMLGYTAEEMIGKSTPLVLHLDNEIDDYADLLHRRLGRRIGGYEVLAARARQGDAEEHEWTLRRKDGNPIVVSLSVTALRNEKGEVTGFLHVANNITERKQAEQALLDSEKKFRNIFDFASVGIYQSTLDGRLITTNRTLAQILGYGSVSELLARSLPREIYLHARDHIRLLRDCESAGATIGREVQWKKSDSTPIWVKLNSHVVKNDSGEVLYFEGFVDDITAKIEAEQIMRTQAVAMEASMDGIAIVTPDGTFNYVNRAFAKLYGYPRESDLIGRLWKILNERKEYARFLKDVVPNFRRRGEWRGEGVGRKKNGSTFQQEISLTRIEDGSIVAVARDITERTYAEEQIKHLAYHDALTGLPNRLLFKDRLGVALTLAQRETRKLAVIFLDLDRFKIINDSLGHNAGDYLLQNVASRIQHCVRESDTVARLGGDEFILLLPMLSQAEGAARIAQKILETIKQPFIIDNRELYVTTSVGISIYPDDGMDSDTLIKNADTAMYQAKELGRNNYQLFNAAINTKALERLALENGVRKALTNDELVLFYQPIYDVASRRIHGIEALIRWNHPDLGIIAPAHFIPLAEATGLMVPIGNWVLRTACKQVKEWQRAGYGDLSVAVNLSVSQIQRGDLARTVREILDETGLDPRFLELEITESSAMLNPETSVKILDALKKIGVRISLDDFGIGQQSLSYLKRFPIDSIKIDQSFIHDITTDSDTAAIVTAIIAMGHKLRLQIVAEGVELDDQRSFLTEQHCDRMQGFLFNAPLPAADLERLLEEQRGSGGEDVLDQPAG